MWFGCLLVVRRLLWVLINSVVMGFLFFVYCFSCLVLFVLFYVVSVFVDLVCFCVLLVWLIGWWM